MFACNMKILSVDVGLINMGMCIYEPQTCTIHEWELLNVRCSSNACHNLVEILKRKGTMFEDVQIVLIERQSKRSCRLQHMQSYLEMYFTLQQKQVIIYSPVLKLLGTGMECKGKNNYTQRKKAAIHLTNEFLRDHPQDARHHKMFASLKKKDDAADSLMQVLAYVKTPDPNKLLNPVKPCLPRKPTEKQILNGKMSKNNIKWLLIHRFIPQAGKIIHVSLDDTDDASHDSTSHRISALHQCVQSDKKVMVSINRFFADVPACIEALAPPEYTTEARGASDNSTIASSLLSAGTCP